MTGRKLALIFGLTVILASSALYLSVTTHQRYLAGAAATSGVGLELREVEIRALEPEDVVMVHLTARNQSGIDYQIDSIWFNLTVENRQVATRSEYPVGKTVSVGQSLDFVIPVGVRGLHMDVADLAETADTPGEDWRAHAMLVIRFPDRRTPVSREFRIRGETP